jgi:hypothetical protein
VLRALLPALALSVGLASTAAANTVLHVDAARGSDTGGCQLAPCRTLSYAISQAEAVPDLVTIQAAAGTYSGDLGLGAADSGLAIIGAGSGTSASTSTIITGVDGNPTIATTSAGTASSLSLSHLRIVNPPSDSSSVIAAGETDLGLSDVAIDVQGTAGAITSSGDTSVSSGSITLESAGSGAAIVDSGRVTLTGTPIAVAGNASAVSGTGPISLTDSPVTLTNAAAGAPAISAAAAPVALEHSSIDVKGTGAAVVTTGGAASLADLTISLENPLSTTSALQLSGLGSSISHVTLGGSWNGAALTDTGSLDIADSSLGSSPTSSSSIASLHDGSATGLGSRITIVRSTLRDATTAAPAVSASNVNVIADSSELLGGVQALDFSVSGGVTRALTLASSTVDAGGLGTRNAAPIQSLSASADNTAGSMALVNVEGSILVEPPAATRAGAAGAATVNCTYSEVPGSAQAASPTLGAINCGAGSNGNTSTSSLGAIFAKPGPPYALNPSWNGVDSVPSSSISLPAPLADSSTDMLGNPRVLNGAGDCTAAIRDRGALELTGHGGVVPEPLIGGPLTVYAHRAATFSGSAPNIRAGAPLSFTWSSSDQGSGSGARFTHTFATPGKFSISLVAHGTTSCTGTTSATFTIHGADRISGFSVAPRSFKAAGSGRTVTPANQLPGGTIVSYRGTEAAQSRFAIQAPRAGRKQGASCRRPSPANRRGRRCTLYATVGTFMHTDAAAGPIRFRFTGRIRGHKLARRTYRLQVTPSNPAGKGRTITATFAIRG